MKLSIQYTKSKLSAWGIHLLGCQSPNSSYISKRLENNYRYFDEVNVDKLKFLVRARKLGFSLEECKELILLFENDNRKSEHVREIAKNKLKSIKKQITDLKDLEKSLKWLVLKCPGDNKPDCPIIEELAKG